jgi:hypothetical protein
MWNLGQFLRDFLYDPELLSQDEVDDASSVRPDRGREDQPIHAQTSPEHYRRKFLITNKKTNFAPYM